MFDPLKLEIFEVSDNFLQGVYPSDLTLDKYDIKGNKTKTALNLSFESALTFGDWDINENWAKYKEEFLKGVQYG